MKTHKNIDRLFQEKLKDFEVSPPKNAWNNIEKRIHSSHRKPLIPLWFKITSAATMLLLLSIAGVNYLNTTSSVNEIDTIVTDSEKTTIPTTINPSEDATENSIQIQSSSETLIVEFNEKENEKVKNSNPVISNKLNPSKINQEKLSNDNEYITSTTSESLLNKQTELNDLEKNGSNLKSIKNNTTITDNTINESLENNKSVSEKSNNDKLNNNNQILTTSQTVLDKNTMLSGIVENDIEKNNYKINKELNQKSNTESEITIIQEESKTEEEIIKKKLVEELPSKEVIAENSENIKQKSSENIEDLLKDEEVKEEDSDSEKWSVATQFGPVFYNSFTAENSLLDESFMANENQINNSISAGIKVGYKLTEKLSLQSGINIINVTSQTDNVFIQTNLNPEFISAIQYDPLAQFMNISSTPPSSDVILARSEVPVINNYTFEGALNQEIGYIEVPLEAKYNLTNGKVGLNIVGGFSTLFLNKNSIQYETEAFSAKIGEANNLNGVTFSGNLGLDVDYKLNKQLFFNISPMLKIQTNTFSNNSGNFKPYILGVYSGLNYSF